MVISSVKFKSGDPVKLKGARWISYDRQECVEGCRPLRLVLGGDMEIEASALVLAPPVMFSLLPGPVVRMNLHLELGTVVRACQQSLRRCCRLPADAPVVVKARPPIRLVNGIMFFT